MRASVIFFAIGSFALMFSLNAPYPPLDAGKLFLAFAILFLVTDPTLAYAPKEVGGTPHYTLTARFVCPFQRQDFTVCRCAHGAVSSRSQRGTS